MRSVLITGTSTGIGRATAVVGAVALATPHVEFVPTTLRRQIGECVVNVPRRGSSLSCLFSAGFAALTNALLERSQPSAF